MRKIYLSLMALLLAVSTAFADTAPYKVDFSSNVDTSNPSFRAAPGWAHLVSTGAYAAQKVTYTWVADGGIGETSCLKASAQSYYDYSDAKDVPLYDLLITPAVTGKVTLQVKKATTSGSIKFYKVTKNGKTYVRGDEIAFEDPGLVSIDFTEVELPSVEAGTYIGIRADNVYIDDFTAESANVVLSKELTISQCTPAITEQKIDCDENNQFEVKATVKVKNTGEIDLNPGDEGYNLQIAVMKPNESGVYVVDKTFTTLAITTALAVGAESNEIVVSAKINENEIEPLTGNTDKARRYDVVECISNTTKVIRNYTPVPYKPIAGIYEGSTNLESGSTFNFGLATQPLTKTFVLYNDGAAPLSITSVTLEGEGFSTEEAAPFEVEKHGEHNIAVTLTSATPGNKTGKLTIKGNDIDDIVLNLTGEVLDPDKWYVDFEDNTMPVNMIAENGWQLSNNLVLGDNKYYAVNNNTDATKLISPLLEVAEGETLGFDAARIFGTISFVEVYYSADRQNWTKLRTLSIDATDDADKLTSDYEGYSWGANTKYKFTRFTIDNIPAGKWYVAFAAGNARVDNILGYKVADVAHDFFVTEKNIPAVGMVNHTFTATAKLKNLTNNIEAADSYTAKLYFDDQVVAEATADELAAAAENSYTFTFTPHSADTFQARVEFQNGEITAKSETVEVSITPETASMEKQIGNADAPDASRGKSAPLALFNNKSESENIYTAEQLGLTKGCKITRIAFKGKSSGNKTVNATTLKVWLENTEDGTPQNVLLDADKTAAMTSVYDGTYTFNVKSTNEELIVVELATPFEYTGKNLRVALHSESSGWATVHFERDNSVDEQSIYRASDSTLPESFEKSKLPVLYISATAEAPTLSGTITGRDNQPVADAVVKMVSGDVEYTATTDAEGKYAIEVFQPALEYTVTVEASSYNTKTLTQTFADGNSETLDVQLTSTTDGIDDITVEESADESIYDLNGRKLNGKPAHGLYIQGGKKYVVK